MRSYVFVFVPVAGSGKCEVWRRRKNDIWKRECETRAVRRHAYRVCKPICQSAHIQIYISTFNAYFSKVLFIISLFIFIQRHAISYTCQASPLSITNVFDTSHPNYTLRASSLDVQFCQATSLQRPEQNMKTNILRPTQHLNRQRSIVNRALLITYLSLTSWLLDSYLIVIW